MSITLFHVFLFSVFCCLTEIIMWFVHKKNCKKANYDCFKCKNWDCLSHYCNKYRK